MKIYTTFDVTGSIITDATIENLYTTLCEYHGVPMYDNDACDLAYHIEAYLAGADNGMECRSTEACPFPTSSGKPVFVHVTTI